MVLPRTRLAGDGSMAANAMLVIRERSRTRRAAREELKEWRAAETRRARKPPTCRNEARKPTGQVLQLSCGATPNECRTEIGQNFASFDAEYRTRVLFINAVHGILPCTSSPPSPAPLRRRPPRLLNPARDQPRLKHHRIRPCGAPRAACALGAVDARPARAQHRARPRQAVDSGLRHHDQGAVRQARRCRGQLQPAPARAAQPCHPYTSGLGALYRRANTGLRIQAEPRTNCLGDWVTEKNRTNA